MSTCVRNRLLAGALLFTIVFLCLCWERDQAAQYVPTTSHSFVYFDSASNRTGPSSHAIRHLLSLPLMSYDESVKLSAASCPTAAVNFDEGSVRENGPAWRQIPSKQISQWRQDIADYLQEKMDQEAAAPATRRGGRGIVMAAGDRAAVLRARTSIRFLRSYNCTLPIEIFHFASELRGEEKDALSDAHNPGDHFGNVTFRAVGGVRKGSNWKEFQIKAAAIQQSSFDEILYLDNDSLMLANPDSLFENQHWAETGLLLWPDYTKSHPTNPVWRLLGQACRNEYEAESGQIVVSRSRHQDVLWVAEFFALRYDTFYGFMGGDRDSFRAAALLLGKKYAGPGRLVAAAGNEIKGRRRGGGHTMLHAGPDGTWMFVHANLLKHGTFSRPLWKSISRATNDRYEAGTTYGSIDPPNDRIGEGVKLWVQQGGKMQTTMETFEGYDKSLVTVEDWDTYEELRGFEDKWFRFGGKG